MLVWFLPLFLVFLMIGLPVFFGLLAAPGILLWLNGQEKDITLLYRNLYNGMDSFPLMAIPFFMLAGELMNRGGITMRLVEFSKPVKSWSLHVYGQNDDPASPHFDDQAKLLSEKKFKPTLFNRDELEGHIKSTTELEWIGRITP